MINRCHYDHFEAVLPKLADGSVKLILADPPYGKPYRETTTSATMRVCDNTSEEEARKTTLALMERADRKITSGGCMVMFRPGSALDPAWLTTGISELGWDCRAVLTWDKGRAKLSNGDSPYGISSVRILILSCTGDALTNHNGSERSDVLNFKPIRPTSAGSALHIYEKPPELIEFLIHKHSYEDELIFEPFGGAGTAFRVAARINRHWVYCESDQQAFDLAITQIAAAQSNATNVA